MAERSQRVRLRHKKTSFPKARAIGRAFAPHEDIYHLILTRSWAEFFLIVTLCFLSANALFALAYCAQPGSITNARPGSFEDAFFFSVQTLATIGYGTFAPATRFGHIMVTLEALIGMLGVALVTGITFAKFARPTARVLFADKICLATRDGVPHLMFRMANWRQNNVVEAQLRVIVLALERTREGESLRVPVELRLLRDRTAVFVMTWQAMHRIDPDSPFYGEGAIERLRARGAEIFLSLSATDETFAAGVHARCAYKLEDIVPGARFHDVVSVLADGTRVIDYRHFHDIVPLPESSDDAQPDGAPR